MVPLWLIVWLFWICIDHAQNWGSLLSVVVQANSLIFNMMFGMLLVLWFMLRCNLLLTPKGFYNKNQSVLYQCRPHWFRPHVTLIQHITTFTRNSVFCWLEYSEKKRKKSQMAWFYEVECTAQCFGVVESAYQCRIWWTGITKSHWIRISVLLNSQRLLRYIYLWCRFFFYSSVLLGGGLILFDSSFLKH